MTRVLRRLYSKSCWCSCVGCRNGLCQPSGGNEQGREKTWGTAVKGQALSISTEKAAYAPGKPIVLSVCFKNFGREDVEVVKTAPLGIYRVDVLLPDGKKSPLTLFGTQREDSEGEGSKTIGALKPGEEARVELELSRLFDFTVAGKYTVSVERAVWNDGGFSSTVKAVSNKLEITVEEPPQNDASPTGETSKSTENTWGTAVEGQALLISTDKAAYAPGKRIVLSVCFKNVGQKDVRVARTNPLTIYRVAVLLPNGKKSAAHALWSSKRSRARLGSNALGTLKPGEETRVELELSRLFDFTLAGKYTVSVERSVWKNGALSSTVKAVSNKLEITVDESLEGR